MPLGSIWNFLKRHRRKFLFTGAFVGGSYLAFQYFKKKFAEFQEKEAEECIEQARRQHHFDSNQRTCNMTVLSMLPNLRDSLRHNMDTERVKGHIQSSSGNKVLLWEELKVMAFSRSIAAVYSSCILVVLLRVQLNIIGGYIYLDNLLKSEMADIEKKELLTANIQEKYLSLIQYFITTGLSELTQAVHSAVESSLGSISLKEKLSLTDVESCVEGIRVRLECGVVQGSSNVATAPLSHFMLPPEQVEDFARKKNPDEVLFEDLLNQTRDMTESEDFHCVLQTCVNKGFARLLDYVAEGYRSSLSNDEEIDSNFYSLRNVRVPLAKLVPVVNGVMERLCGDSPNPFIQDLLVMEPLRDLAANVYEAFSQRDESSERAGLQR